MIQTVPTPEGGIAKLHQCVYKPMHKGAQAVHADMPMNVLFYAGHKDTPRVTSHSELYKAVTSGSKLSALRHKNSTAVKSANCPEAQAA